VDTVCKLKLGTSVRSWRQCRRPEAKPPWQHCSYRVQGKSPAIKLLSSGKHNPPLVIL